jgi:hypothetical protein
VVPPTSDARAEEGGQTGIAPVIGGVVGAVVLLAGAIVAFVLWHRWSGGFVPESESDHAAEFKAWPNDQGEREMQEAGAPLVTQADVATFADVLTFADDDRIIAFQTNVSESCYSML